MSSTPLLTTDRLLLRPFRVEDAGFVAETLGDARVTQTLLDYPESITLATAIDWIHTSLQHFAVGDAFIFAMVRQADKALLGCIDIELQTGHQRGDMAYWMHPDYWGQGYTTEAAHAILHFAFDTLHLHRVYAQCMAHNRASEQVMIHVGMEHEATFREAVHKDGQYHDMLVYGQIKH
jgi:[ribosomal protein S5]-alanine N-acetyltransferase